MGIHEVWAGHGQRRERLGSWKSRVTCWLLGFNDVIVLRQSKHISTSFPRWFCTWYRPASASCTPEAASTRWEARSSGPKDRGFGGGALGGEVSGCSLRFGMRRVALINSDFVWAPPGSHVGHLRQRSVEQLASLLQRSASQVLVSKEALEAFDSTLNGLLGSGNLPNTRTHPPPLITEVANPA